MKKKKNNPGFMRSSSGGQPGRLFRQFRFCGRERR